MIFLGVDGCKIGWFVIAINSDGKTWEVRDFRSIRELWERYKNAALILIDIPIGLRDKGPAERKCDLEARRLLGQRKYSVFRVPCRAAVHASTREERDINESYTGKRLSKQVINIIPKIRQVDELICRVKTAKYIIKEIHPELCFWGINGGNPMKHRKKTDKGFRERIEVLQAVYDQTEAVVKYSLKKYRRRHVARDDIADALVAAVTGVLGKGKGEFIPQNGEYDSNGLPMRMLYYVC